MRAAVSVIGVAILVAVIPMRAVVDALARIQLSTWVVCAGVFFAGHYCNAVKLHFLLGRHETPLSSCVRAQYAGLVANLGLPGLAGGDLVRGAYLAPTVGAKRVALASVADRVIDLLSVATLVVAALPFAGMPVGFDVGVKVAWWSVVAAVSVAAVAVAVLWLRPDRIPPDVVAFLRSRRWALVGAVSISLLVQSTFVLVNVWLARQVGVTIGLAPWFVAWPLSKLIAVLPISLGGIGVREATLVSLLAPYGAPRAAVLASGILWQAVVTVTGLTGFLVTQMLPRRAPRPASIESPAAKA